MEVFCEKIYKENYELFELTLINDYNERLVIKLDRFNFGRTYQCLCNYLLKEEFYLSLIDRSRTYAEDIINFILKDNLQSHVKIVYNIMYLILDGCTNYLEVKIGA